MSQRIRKPYMLFVFIGCWACVHGSGSRYRTKARVLNPGTPIAVVQVPTGQLDIAGGLTSQEVTEGLERVNQRLQFCYEDRIEQDHVVRGQLVFKLEVRGKTGQVLKIKFLDKVSSLKDAALQACFGYHLQRMRFVRTIRGDTKLEIHFVLNTRS